MEGLKEGRRTGPAPQIFPLTRLYHWSSLNFWCQNLRHFLPSLVLVSRTQEFHFSVQILWGTASVPCRHPLSTGSTLRAGHEDVNYRVYSLYGHIWSQCRGGCSAFTTSLQNTCRVGLRENGMIYMIATCVTISYSLKKFLDYSKDKSARSKWLHRILTVSSETHGNLNSVRREKR